MTSLNESTVEAAALGWLEDFGRRRTARTSRLMHRMLSARNTHRWCWSAAYGTPLPR